jgi:hypothetical protein
MNHQQDERSGGGLLLRGQGGSGHRLRPDRPFMWCRPIGRLPRRRLVPAWVVWPHRGIGRPKLSAVPDRYPWTGIPAGNGHAYPIVGIEAKVGYAHEGESQRRRGPWFPRSVWCHITGLGYEPSWSGERQLHL